MIEIQDPQAFEQVLQRFKNKYRKRIEKFIIYPKQRWGVTGLLVLSYLIRVMLIGGFYVISYVFALYVLHLGVHFLTPQGMPQIDEEDDDEEDVFGSLPVQTAETHTDGNNNNNTENLQERGPLIRSMNEFKFWNKVTLAAILSLVCTSTRAVDLPVFWPFLLAYFLMLVVFTVRQQIKHMKKYQYSFIDFFRKSTK